MLITYSKTTVTSGNLTMTGVRFTYMQTGLIGASVCEMIIDRIKKDKAYTDTDTSSGYYIFESIASFWS